MVPACTLATTVGENDRYSPRHDGRSEYNESHL